jgi:hypothetical protein
MTVRLRSFAVLLPIVFLALLDFSTAADVDLLIEMAEYDLRL